jgi:hypothetical protein
MQAVMELSFAELWTLYERAFAAFAWKKIISGRVDVSIFAFDVEDGVEAALGDASDIAGLAS